MRRVEPERRQHRQHFVLEVALQPARLLGRPPIARDKADAFTIEFGQQGIVPERILSGDEFEHARADAREQLARRHCVGAGLDVAEFEMMAQDRDLHFEEFVEVRIGDAQEAHAFEQRHTRILRLREHAEIEFELGKFAVEVQRGVAKVRCMRARRARFACSDRRSVSGVRAAGCVSARMHCDGFLTIHGASSVTTSGASRRSRANTQEKVLPTPSSLSISSRA